MNEQLSKSQIKKQIINAAVEEYIQTPKYEKSAAKIAAKYGINRKTLIIHLKERGVPIIQNRGGYSVNDTVFEKIDSEEKAY